MTETEVRYFSVDQANASLPLVSRIVRDLLELHPRWRGAVAAFEAEQLVAAGGTGESVAAKDARVEAGRLAAEIEACLAELEQVGCAFKGFDVGLVDFPSTLAGREVYLCWQYGEASVDHWHELEGGFAGRQQLDPFNFPER